MPTGVVTRLSFTPVKGTRLLDADRLMLERTGAQENRRFFVVDNRDRMVNGKQLGPLQQVVTSYDAQARRLALELPDGERVEGELSHGAVARVRFFSRPRDVRIVDGPWAEALSRHLGQPVRVAEAAADGTAVDRGVAASVSLISRASLQRLAEVAGEPDVDGRRFRMLAEVDGIAANEEDRWVGKVVALGPARIRIHGHVGRCLVTNRHPESGETDLPTLDLLWEYRHGEETTEPLALGIYGEVVVPGAVSVGDPVVVEEE